MTLIQEIYQIIFQGIIAFENKDNTEALKFFNASKVLINQT